MGPSEIGDGPSLTAETSPPVFGLTKVLTLTVASTVPVVIDTRVRMKTRPALMRSSMYLALPNRLSKFNSVFGANAGQFRQKKNSHLSSGSATRGGHSCR